MVEPVIGLEVHAELLTHSKMFCGCRVVDSVAADPNSAVCPVCLGMPGMLPVINRRAVDMAMLVGLALHCTIQPHNVFARKNYFYPDLPKGYQISQFELPLCRDGHLDLELADGGSKRVRIRRVHLEEDTGKLTHLDDGRSLVDYNRSGVPLLEIVSEPDLATAAEAVAYAAALRQILRYLGVNSGDMEKGVIRFEANVSIRPAGSTALNTRTEVKNLNSFKALAGSIDYEIARQAHIVDGGGTVTQATLGWSEARGETFSQRGKEDAHDYRYFPEPDLPPLRLPQAWLDEVAAQLPELPDEKLARYRTAFGLSDYDALQLSADRPVAEWFDAAVTAAAATAGSNPVLPKDIANFVLNNLFSLMNDAGQTIDACRVTAAGLVELIALAKSGTINSSTARDVLAEMFATGAAAPAIVAEKGLAQISDAASLEGLVRKLLEENPSQVADYRAGKTQLRGWFVGQIMRATRGKADPGVVNQLLDQQLDSG